MNYETLIPLTLIYSVFLVVGVLGNLATCLVILFNVYMRWGLRDLIKPYLILTGTRPTCT